MWGFSALDLARFQFAFTISAHIIFPAFTIGIASWLALLNLRWLWTRDEAFLRLFEQWRTIFAVVFGMGVVSGIVMSYQFGTNWARFSDRAGPVIGPLMAYEVLSAFFLEAGFLGIMLFGREKVGDTLHAVATCIVAVGTLLSAFWIISANSWMHTPAGFALSEVGQFVPTDWWAAIFNPSFPYRLVHMVLATYLTTALVVGAAGAWHLLRGENTPGVRRMFSDAMWMAVLVTPLQIVAGDMHGVNTFEHQPQKIAAIEGHYEGFPEGRAPLILFGIPDDKAEITRHRIEVPLAGSLILTHALTKPVPGLKDFAPGDRPPARTIFWTFRLMVGAGVAMLGLGLWAAWARRRGRLYTDRWLHRAAVVMGPAGFFAIICGWVTTEIGRQPWTVWGHMRTADSVSDVSVRMVSTSLVSFIVVYFLVFGAGTVYVLRLMARPPEARKDVEEIGPTSAAGITPVADPVTPD